MFSETIAASPDTPLIGSRARLRALRISPHPRRLPENSAVAAATCLGRDLTDKKVFRLATIHALRHSGYFENLDLLGDAAE
jgi:hypothetical protein